ncbi:hypothetical protein K9M42_02580 [Patescibacteria group bacterium]|nr:hypothetical protein [Patescibacteria group bacterium]
MTQDEFYWVIYEMIDDVVGPAFDTGMLADKIRDFFYDNFNFIVNDSEFQHITKLIKKEKD